MVNNNNCTFSACKCLGIFISLVIGVIVAVLFAFDFIPFIYTTVWIMLSLAVLILIFLIFGVYIGAVALPGVLKRCLCTNALYLWAGIIGTIIFAIIALSIFLIPIFLVVIFIVAILTFFFALMIIGLTAFIKCIIYKMSSIS